MAQGLIDGSLAEEVPVECETDQPTVVAQCSELFVGQAPWVIPYRPGERVGHEYGGCVQVKHLEEASVVQMSQVEQERALLERSDQLPTRRFEGRCAVVVATEPVVGLVVPGERQAAQGVLGPQHVELIGSDAREVESL